MQINPSGNIHIKTHNDLDAVVSVLLLKAAFTNKIVSTEYNTYNDIEKSIENFIKNHEYTSNDTLFITDISFSDDLAEKLNKIEDLTVYLLDHHKTAKRLSRYTWAKVSTNPEESAAEVVFNTLSQATLYPYASLVAATSAWDTWLINSKHRKNGEAINTLLGFIGKEEFISAHLSNPEAWRTDTYYTRLIDHLSAKKDRFIQQVINKQLHTARIHLDGLCHHYVVIFATDYISELGNAILDSSHGNIDYVCVINPALNSVSLRSKDNVDVSKLAKYLGGGGHKNAAGFRISFTDEIEDTLDQVLNHVNY